MSHEPSGTSSRNLHHFGQGVNTQEFRAYRFPTPEENRAVYGREEPPEYKLEKVTCPVLLFWGEADWLAQPRGVARIADQLPNLIDSVKVWFIFLTNSHLRNSIFVGLSWYVEPP